MKITGSTLAHNKGMEEVMRIFTNRTTNKLGASKEALCNQTSPLIPYEHDDHVGTGVLSGILQPCGQMIECLSSEEREAKLQM